jgi:long-chain acyl-CoA synthetase
VAPEPLEDRIRAHPLVSQAVVVGDARPFIAALVTLDEDAVRERAIEHGRGDAVAADLVDDEALDAEVQAAIDDANRSVSRAESIRKFALLPRDLTIESGELTPTLKVRRSIVEKSYQHVIDGLYS